MYSRVCLFSPQKSHKMMQPIIYTSTIYISISYNILFLNTLHKQPCASYPPYWSVVTKRIFLVQLSSAVSKRSVFILENSFGDQQDKALHDYIEASLMLQYNSC